MDVLTHPIPKRFKLQFPFAPMGVLDPQSSLWYSKKFSYGSKTLHRTSEGLWEMFEGDFADTCDEGPVECQACADTEARTPIGVIGNYLMS